ncbi:uncharacterized protein EV422DRAFT_538294 [Fimicolochytrium jonesii]|uniref:uncharacterized protein n=1 Tax=Fimicolochytrium jonesii TaxID=1396493 RepID=UPI0022FE33E9|nr:uncharacterized protein EV422DRAFT_538294 [Fimicolochytrium jonesii]KAI8818361.1 hypothetical protein EV422DRAFT_538294 [Fimicolochytrium jonesii]
MTTIQTEDQVRQDKGVSLMGTYLLQGWVMTDSPCPSSGCNLPVMRTRDRTRSLCVLCNDPKDPYPPASVDVAPTAPVVIGQLNAGELSGPAHHFEVTPEEDAELEAFLKTEKDAEISSHAPTTARSERAQRSDRASKLLGEKLLAGWSLLDVVCDDCGGVPLMRNHQKKNVCVGCGAGSGIPTTTTLPSANVSTSVPSKVAPSPTHIEKTPRLDDAIQRDLPESKRRKTDSASPSARCDYEHISIQLAKTLTTIRKRMEDFRQSIESSEDVEGIRALCEGIESCAKAISALESARKATN